MSRTLHGGRRHLRGHCKMALCPPSDWAGGARRAARKQVRSCCGRRDVSQGDAWLECGPGSLRPGMRSRAPGGRSYAAAARQFRIPTSLARQSGVVQELSARAAPPLSAWRHRQGEMSLCRLFPRFRPIAHESVTLDSANDETSTACNEKRFVRRPCSTSRLPEIVT